MPFDFQNRYMRNYYLFIPALLCALCGSSQNLVLNPDFEKTRTCAENIGLLSAVCENWSTPTSGTPDLFNSCSFGRASAPSNYVGEQEPFSGKNYAGIYLYNGSDYLEYVQGQLAAPLEAGKSYIVTFYISLSTISDYAISDIGVLFTKDKVSVTDKLLRSADVLERNDHHERSQINVPARFYYNRKGDWTKVKTTFTARGGERYFSIGNFHDAETTDKFKIDEKSSRRVMYYYIDMVSVVRDETKISETVQFQPGKSYTLRNVHFDFASIILDKPAKDELEQLAHFLTQHPNAKIAINGHTDNVGSNAYNLDISKKRADSVAQFLIAAGTDPGRITTKGFGFTMPVSSNDSETGRAMNRRVAFVVSE